MGRKVSVAVGNLLPGDAEQLLQLASFQLLRVLSRIVLQTQVQLYPSPNWAICANDPWHNPWFLNVQQEAQCVAAATYYV